MTAGKAGYFTPVRIAFWIIMTVLLSIGVYGWLAIVVAPTHRGRDRAFCIMNQRNLQQTVRNYQGLNYLKPGDALDWSKLIGPGLWLEQKPVCPVHGDYALSPMIPETGTLVAPCSDPEHRPMDIKEW